jgi:uncharacterized protein (TIGR02145 family)
VKLIFRLVFLVALISSGLNSCKKDDEKTLTVITGKVSDITYHSARCSVDWNGAGENLAEVGICLSKNPEPTFQDRVIEFAIDSNETASYSGFESLVPDTKYYIRAYLNEFAESSVMTYYGQEVEFTTLEFDKAIKFNSALTYGSVSDIEGNSYKTIQIGKQVWMAENLRTTRLNDNEQIPKVTFPLNWSDIKTPGYNWYNEDSVTYSTAYGAIYNWYTVNTKKLCPVGWHVPSDNEWETMFAFLGGPDVAAIKMKETGVIHWNSPNDWATNESGFTALPGLGPGYYEGWWSTTKMNYLGNMVWTYWIIHGSKWLNRSELHVSIGNNVRCIQD